MTVRGWNDLEIGTTSDRSVTIRVNGVTTCTAEELGRVDGAVAL
ncbi:hypothetical protein [Alienimonas sp. DA493]